MVEYLRRNTIYQGVLLPPRSWSTIGCHYSPQSLSSLYWTFTQSTHHFLFHSFIWITQWLYSKCAKCAYTQQKGLNVQKSSCREFLLNVLLLPGDEASRGHKVVTQKVSLLLCCSCRLTRLPVLHRLQIPRAVISPGSIDNHVIGGLPVSEARRCVGLRPALAQEVVNAQGGQGYFHHLLWLQADGGPEDPQPVHQNPKGVFCHPPCPRQPDVQNPLRVVHPLCRVRLHEVIP